MSVLWVEEPLLPNKVQNQLNTAQAYLKNDYNGIRMNLEAMEFPQEQGPLLKGCCWEGTILVARTPSGC